MLHGHTAPGPEEKFSEVPGHSQATSHMHTRRWPRLRARCREPLHAQPQQTPRQPPGSAPPGMHTLPGAGEDTPRHPDNRP